MTNPRFERHLRTMIDNGWDVQGHDPSAVVDDNFAQFYTYWSHTGDITMATLSVDRFFQLIEDPKIEHTPDLREPEALANALCHYGLAHLKEGKDKDRESLIGLLGAFYMASTKTGKTYFTQARGMPFAFIVIMYPSNKKRSNFSVRPALSVGNSLMTVSEVRDFAATVMDHDKRSGKKSYFKYLKN